MSDVTTITLKTLSPLWTGGVDGKSDRLHTTGIIGSLRWWYEAIVRGLGGQACDPVVNPCLYDEDKPHNGLCLSCHMFGATGWARRFRLIVQDRTSQGGPQGSKQPAGNRFKRDGRTRPSWYFKGGREGDLELRIVPTGPDFDPAIIQGTLSLIERHGGLAAKPQLGYGWIEIASAPSFSVSAFVEKLRSTAAQQPTANGDLPSLDTMFFAQLQVPESGLTPTLNLRYDLRSVFRSAFNGDRRLRPWVCGYVRGNERQASKINVTQAVDSVVRVWGWIPNNTPVQGVGRDEVVDQIQATLGAYGTLKSWREFDSERDSVNRFSENKGYLAHLLEAQS